MEKKKVCNIKLFEMRRFLDQIVIRCLCWQIHYAPAGFRLVKACTELSQSVFSGAFLRGAPEMKCDTCQGNPSEQNDRRGAGSQNQSSYHEAIHSDVSGQVQGQPRTRQQQTCARVDGTS